MISARTKYMAQLVADAFNVAEYEASVSFLKLYLKFISHILIWFFTILSYFHRRLTFEPMKIWFKPRNV